MLLRASAFIADNAPQRFMLGPEHHATSVTTASSGTA